MSTVTLPEPQVAKPLPPPMTLEAGSIVTVRMRGHSRTNGEEYFAPAVVLNQFMPGGELELQVWDSTSGTAYIHSYPIRDLSTRGDGNLREVYETRSNIGKVLFSPAQFTTAVEAMEVFDKDLLEQRRELVSLHKLVNELTVQVQRLVSSSGTATPSAPTGASKTQVSAK